MHILSISLLLTIVYFLIPGGISPWPGRSAADGGGSALAAGGNSGIRSLDFQGFKVLYDSSEIFLADAREAEEYQAGHIPGAVNIPYNEAENWLDSLENMPRRPAILITYCDGSDCMASYELARRIGFFFGENYAYHGGWEEWKEHHGR